MARQKRAPADTPQTSKYNNLTFVTSDLPFNWAGVSPEWVKDAVVAVLELGDAIMFSTTSDGGAIRVGVFEGDSRHFRYCTSAAELENLLRGFAQSQD